MNDFDPREVEIQSFYAGGSLTVRYRGHYAGSIERLDNGEYSCAVDLERDGEKVLQRFGRSSSKQDAAESVARQWLLSNPKARLKTGRRSFFLPEAQDDSQRDRAYRDLVSHAKQSTGWDIEASKIYSLSFTKDRKNYVATVGEVDSYSGGMVIAILESTGTAYLLYIAVAGGLRGPVMVNKNNVTDLIGFVD